MLYIAFFSMYIAAGLLALLYETGLLAGGQFVTDDGMIYTLDTGVVLLTLCVSFLSLKLFAFPWVKRQLELQTTNRLERRLYLLRYLLMGGNALVAISVYYATLSTNGLFCAGVLALASLCTLPNSTKL